MIVLLLTCVLQTIFHVTSYQFLPLKEISTYSFGGSSNILHKYVTPIVDIPYHVLIVYNNLYCSGSLIRSKIVVTAASCLTKRKTHRTYVKVGANSITEYGQVIPVVDVKIHEYFRYNNRMDNDIALLMLANDVYFGATVKKVIVVEPETALRTGVTIDVSGWGGPNLHSKFLNLLLWTEMVVLAREECYNVYASLMTPSNFCAKYQPDRRLSDNGGPVVYKDFLVGIVSFGATNSDDPHVAVLTNVSYFSRWIFLNTKRLLNKYCVQARDLSGYTSSEEEYYYSSS